MQGMTQKKGLSQNGSSFSCLSPLHVVAAGPAGGLLFFCVRRKEAKEDHICVQGMTQKKGLSQNGSSFSCLPPLHVVAAGPAGGLLFFCVRRKEAKEDHICVQGMTQKKELSQNGSFFLHIIPLLHIRFSGGCGRGLFPGKSLLPPSQPSPSHSSSNSSSNRRPLENSTPLFRRMRRMMVFWSLKSLWPLSIH